jgi:hypothetical protein
MVNMQDAIESKKATKEETQILSLRWFEFPLVFVFFSMFI